MPQKISAILIDKKKTRAYLKGAKNDIHERDKKYQQMVSKIYRRLARQHGWTVIQCFKNNKLLTPTVIHQIIIDKLGDALNGKTGI